jgi:predicted transposase YdaD
MAREVLDMSDATPTIESILEETGWAARYEARAEEKTRSEIAGNLLNMGWTVEQTASTARLSVEKVRAFAAAMRNE